MGSGRLSELLARKRPLSPSLGAKIATSLDLKPRERDLFLSKLAARRLRGEPPRADRHEELSADPFHLIADWYHYALLSLLETDDFKCDVRWIAKRLVITTSEVRSAIERLCRLGFVQLDGSKLRRTKGPIKTTSDVPSSALRLSHRQSLEQAIAALEDVPVELRDITSITMPIDPHKLPLAKECIRRFRRDLAELLESGAKTDVYNLNIQLVPITRQKEI